VGTSAGAITATLLAAGFTTDEMFEAVNERDVKGKPRFASFMDLPTANHFSEADKNNSDIMEIFRRVDVPLIPGMLEGKFDQLFIDALMKLPHFRQLFCSVECGGFLPVISFSNGYEKN
jgi:NTE family protein